MKFSMIFVVALTFCGWMQPAEAKWSVSAFNIRNFDKDPGAGLTDLRELGKVLKDVQSDVMAFEEVVNKKAFDSLIKENLPGYSYSISKCGGFGKQFLAVVYNPQVFQLVSETEDLKFSGSGGKCGSLRPVLLVTLKHKASKTDYTFGAIHLKAGSNEKAYAQRWKQYLQLEDLSDHYAKTNLILLGDFNTTGYNIKDSDYEKFEDFITASSMRTTSETIACTNYWTGTLGGAEHQPSILDHIVIQDKNMGAIEKVRVGSHCAKSDCLPATPQELGVTYESVSDHCPVQVTFK